MAPCHLSTGCCEEMTSCASPYPQRHITGSELSSAFGASRTWPELLLARPGSDRQAASRPSTMELVNGNDGMQWKLTQPYSPALLPDMSTFGSFGIRI